MYRIARYFSYTFRCMKIALKIMKVGVYLDFRRIVDALNYPPCQVNWRTNIINFSCHVLVIFFIYLEVHFISKSFCKGLVIILSEI